MRVWWKLLLAGALVGCAADVEPVDDEGDVDAVGVTRQALSACDETVPANRYIDGIPAYAQCDATLNSAIYSNNGIDTSTTQMGADWIRTQYSGGYQCTELAHRYLHFKWNVRWLPRGNAGEWCASQPPADSGMEQTTTPVHGDLMVLAGGSCGAGQGTGHVVVIDTVDPASGRLSVVEQNRANRGSYMPTCGACFLHVKANDGSSGSGGAGAPPSAGAGAAGRMAAGGMAAVPPVTPPPATPPPATPPPTTPPAATPPAATPPAMTPAPAPNPMSAAQAGAAAQPVAAGAAANGPLPGAKIPILPSSSSSDDAGCSIAAGPGGRKATGVVPYLIPLMLALGLGSRRRSRRDRLRPTA